MSKAKFLRGILFLAVGIILYVVLTIVNRVVGFTNEFLISDIVFMNLAIILIISGLIFITIAFAIRYRAYKKPLQGRVDTSKIRDAIGGIILYMGLVTISFSYVVMMWPPYKPSYLGLLIGFLMMLAGAYLIKIVSKLKEISKKEEPGELTMRVRRKVKEWIEREKQESKKRIEKERKERNKKKKTKKIEIERVKSGNCSYCELARQHHLSECPECGTKILKVKGKIKLL